MVTDTRKPLQEPFPNLAQALADAGFASYRFDFAGNGESEGSFQYFNYQRVSEGSSQGRFAPHVGWIGSPAASCCPTVAVPGAAPRCPTAFPCVRRWRTSAALPCTCTGH